MQDFSVMVGARKDSGVGTDGLPYSAYALAGPVAVGVLYDVHCALLDGKDLPYDFNDANMCFLLKDERVADSSGDLIREPCELRALSLANTDNKIVSTAITVPFAAVAEHVVHENQVSVTLFRLPRATQSLHLARR